MFKLMQEMDVQKMIGDVVELPIEKVQSFYQEIFKPYRGTRLDEMVESVGEYGIITPIIVRDIGEKYEILSGHNRVLAARKAGLESVPALVRERVSDDEARFIVTESNILQRGFMEFSVVERARCIAVRHAAMKSQGMRMDLVNAVDRDEFDKEEIKKLDSDQAVADSFDLSERQVSRYLKIDSLTDELKFFVDAEKIKFTIASELAFLIEDNQRILADVMGEHGVNVDGNDAKALKDLQAVKAFSKEFVVEILVDLVDMEEIRYRLSQKMIDKYFDGMDKEQIHDVLEAALDLWFSQNEAAV